MSGFTSSTTAMKIFEAHVKSANADMVREHIFSTAPGPDGKRIGWVGLGDPLDLDLVAGIDHGAFMAFSLRIDERKPSSAAIKIRLAEAIKEEMAASPEGKVTGKRKKELKESITAAVTAKAEYIPSLVDCLLEVNAGRLYVSTTSDSVLAIFLELFRKTFGVEPTPLAPKTDMAALFARIFKEDVPLGGETVRANGCAVSLATPEQAESRAQVAVVNNEGAVQTALNDGLHITKMALVAVEDELEVAFTLADDLSVSALKLPKGERGDDPEATLLLKADACARVARVVEALSK